MGEVCGRSVGAMDLHRMNLSPARSMVPVHIWLAGTSQRVLSALAWRLEAWRVTAEWGYEVSVSILVGMDRKREKQDKQFGLWGWLWAAFEVLQWLESYVICGCPFTSLKDISRCKTFQLPPVPSLKYRSSSWKLQRLSGIRVWEWIFWYFWVLQMTATCRAFYRRVATWKHLIDLCPFGGLAYQPTDFLVSGVH